MTPQPEKEPMTAEKLVEALFFDLDERKGFDTGGVDDDVKEEWRSDWLEIINQHTEELQAENKKLLDALVASNTEQERLRRATFSIGRERDNLQAEVERLKVTVAGKQYNANILRQENERLSMELSVTRRTDRNSVIDECLQALAPLTVHESVLISGIYCSGLYFKRDVERALQALKTKEQGGV